MEILDKLNETAMQIILHSGNGRAKIHQAIRMSLKDLDGTQRDAVAELMKQGGDDINQAHRVQTTIMQELIESATPPTILFTHAQDTLMTIIAEKNMAKYIIELNYKLGGL